MDIGTQGLKAVVADEQLNILGEAAESYSVSYPRPGWAEQNPALWEAAMPRVISAALEKAGASPRDVRAAGVAGQLDGCIAVGKDGRPLSTCLIWMDRRAALPPSIPDAAALRKITGVNPDPGHMAAKIKWLIENSPVCRGAARFHQPVSYIVSRLTGRHVFDCGLASTTMLYSLENHDYDPALLSAFGIDRERLPDIAEAAEAAGNLTAEGAKLTGLPEGITVAVGTGDDFSSPLGAGMAAPGTVACVLGTAEVVGALDLYPKIDAEGLVETHGYAGGVFFIENPGWLSGGALTWLIKTLGLNDVRELDQLAADVSPGADGLTFIPALSGAMAPEWIAAARGCFYGLTPAHGAGHLARAVLEGCAFAMRDVVERLRTLRVSTDSMLLVGGGAKSDVWMRMRADVSGIPVVRARRVDTSPLGAAMLAAVASGIQTDINTCAALVEDHSDPIEPAALNRQAYDNAYGAYRRLFDCLRPMF
jgi:xylulokinase